MANIKSYYKYSYVIFKTVYFLSIAYKIFLNCMLKLMVPLGLWKL